MTNPLAVFVSTVLFFLGGVTFGFALGRIFYGRKREMK